jgi:hypothetical protein
MRYLASAILALNLTNLTAADIVEVDALVFGASYHFQNRDTYKFNQCNPGLGVAGWYTTNTDDLLSVGGIAAGYRNSYRDMSYVAAPAVKLTLGDRDGFHYGLIGGAGFVTGYGGAGLGLLGAGTVGYKQVNVDFTYMPCTKTTDKTLPPSAAVAVWLRYTVATW